MSWLVTVENASYQLSFPIAIMRRWWHFKFLVLCFVFLQASNSQKSFLKVVGMAAKSGMARFATCTITNNKQLMNMSISDKELADATARSTCKIVPNDDGVHYEVEWEGNSSHRTPDQVHTQLYRKLHGNRFLRVVLDVITLNK